MQQDSTIPQNSNTSPHNLPEMPKPEEPVTTDVRNKKSEGWKSVFSTLFIVISAPLIALLLINFVFQSYEVDGPSMESTLQNADRLIVWKLPKTVANIRGNHYIPNRDDIIIFKKRDSFISGQGGEKQLIKRVIGLPGDRVVVKNGTVTVYNSENPNGFNPDEGRDHGTNTTYTANDTDLTVGDNEVFVLGDNRPDSLDSRAFGPISSDVIVGKLEFRIFPFNTFEHF